MLAVLVDGDDAMTAIPILSLDHLHLLGVGRVNGVDRVQRLQLGSAPVLLGRELAVTLSFLLGDALLDVGRDPVDNGASDRLTAAALAGRGEITVRVLQISIDTVDSRFGFKQRHIRVSKCGGTTGVVGVSPWDDAGDDMMPRRGLLKLGYLDATGIRDIGNAAPGVVNGRLAAGQQG